MIKWYLYERYVKNKEGEGPSSPPAAPPGVEPSKPAEGGGDIDEATEGR